MSVVMYRLGGRLYPLRRAPRCKVCNSPHRQEIELGVLGGTGYTAIVASLPQEADVNAEGIGVHVNRGHMPLGEVIRRKVLEQRAEELGRSLEEGAESVIDHIAVGRMVMQRVWRRMAAGEVEPTVGDAAAFARVMVQAEALAGDDLDRQAIMGAFMAYADAIDTEASPEVAERIAARIRDNLVLAGLARSQRGQAIEAEVVSEE